jgi:GMP synthase (glutamine-hydrolysing)
MSPFDTVLVVDFGAQYSQLIARRVREVQVYSEIVPWSITAEELRERNPVGIILSGGPASVYAEVAPRIDPAIFDLGVPILGICYGAQLLCLQLGGEVARTGSGEYGRTAVSVASPSGLLVGGDGALDVWMSHADSMVRPPEGFSVTASSLEVAVVALESPERRIYGVQFHPEVVHTTGGQELLERFCLGICGAKQSWTRSSVIELATDAIREQVGERRVLCALSGGVDSSVTAALVHRAIGDQLTCVFVDTGLMRAGEAEQVEATFREQFEVDLVHVRAEERFFGALAGVTDPEAKRKIIGELFIRLFEEVSSELSDIAFLAQGTLYPDIVESGTGDAATIKSHHNVGGLPDDMEFELVEPLRQLFKDEVRAIGEELGLPSEMVWRQPFPGPGLGVRIIGEVTKERADTLREADAIVLDEIQKAGLDRAIWQYFAVLPTIRSVGVMGDERTYGYPVIIRAVTSEDAMTADWARLPYELLERLSSRIINEVKGVNRVAYDITSKPPGTIEWE